MIVYDINFILMILKTTFNDMIFHFFIKLFIYKFLVIINIYLQIKNI